MNTPSDDHTNLNCTMNTPSCKTTQRQKQTPNVYNYITNILLSQTHK